MPWEITHLKDSNVLSIRVWGEVTVSTWQRQVKESIERAQELSCALYLVDYRDANMKMSFLDLFNRPQFYAEVGLSHAARIALIFGEDYPEAGFIELVTGNRGYQVEVFSSQEAAIAWLTSTTEAAT